MIQSSLSLSAAESDLLVGFAETEITPAIEGAPPVWIAGYGHGRRATGVHDPLMARCVVLKHGEERIALVAVDLVGLQYPEVKRIRRFLADYRYVMVASTHNHEGPDVIGIWGQTPLQRGVNQEYLNSVITRCIETVRAANQRLEPVTAEYGTAIDDSLVRDSREPQVKDNVMRVLKFKRISDQSLAGVLVQYSCHPESLGSRNTLLTADFPHYTVATLKAKLNCPVAYFSGAVGGLMSNPSPWRDPDGKEHSDGNFAYAEVYGNAVAEVLLNAIDTSRPVPLTPFAIAAKPIAIPIDNKMYRAARELGVLQRPGFIATNDPEKIGADATDAGADQRLTVETEVAYVRLGELNIVGIPGEIYPELLYRQIQEPLDAGADFPDAPKEPSVVDLIPNDKWLLIGLANDEIGYIIPKRQWDEQPPFCYGRTKSQYGEVNSCSPDVAPIIMQALARRVKEAAAR